LKVGFLPKKLNGVKDSTGDYTVRKTQFQSILDKYERELTFTDVYGGTVPTVENLTLNIRKLDVQPNHTFRKLARYDDAVAFVSYMDDLAFKSDVNDPVVEAAKLNRKAVAGWPESLEFKSKGEAVDSPAWWNCYYDPKCDYFPFFGYSPKIEWKEIFEIVNGKIRGFATGCVRLVLHQREFFGQVSDKLKNYKWSFHGFSPFHGGTTKFVNYLGWSRRWIRWDTSGWDRLFALMKEVAFLYAHKLNIPADKKGRFERLFGENGYYTLMKFFYVMPDGSVVLMEGSNPSGQGLTTEFNTTGHKLVLAMFFLTMIPGLTFEELESFRIALYSDDVVVAIPSPGEPWASEMESLFPRDDPGKVYRPWLKENFGWETKFFVSDDAPHLDAIVFLGFNPVPHPTIPGHYLPRWKRERIMTPFFRCYEGRADAAQLSTLRSVLVMSYADPALHAVLARAYSEVLYSLRTSVDPVISAAVKFGVPNAAQMDCLFTNLESGAHPFLEEGLTEFLPRFDGRLEVEKSVLGKPSRVKLQAVMSEHVGKVQEGGQSEGKRIIGKAKQLRAEIKKAVKGGGANPTKAPPPTPREGGGGGNANAKGGKKGGGVVDGLGPQHGQGVGTNSDGGGAHAVRPVLSPKVQPSVAVPKKKLAGPARALAIPLLKTTSTGNKIAIGTLHRTTGTESLPVSNVGKMKSSVNGLSVSRNITFGGMKSHAYVDKDGEHVQFQCQQYFGKVTTNVASGEGATVGPGTRLFFRKVNPASFGGAVLQESKNWQRWDIRRAEFKFVSCAESTDRGSVYLQYIADPQLPHVDTGVDEINHATTGGMMVSSSVYNENPVVLTVNPSELVKKLNVGNSADSNFNTEGSFCISVLDDIAKAIAIGDVFVEYDIIFSDRLLAYSVTDVPDSTMELTWNFTAGYAGSQGEGLVGPFDADPGFPCPAGTFVAVMNNPPPSPNFRGVARCLGYVNNGAGTSSADDTPLQWHTVDEEGSTPFLFGQVFNLLLDGFGDSGSYPWETDGTDGVAFQMFVADDAQSEGYDAPGINQVSLMSVPNPTPHAKGTLQFEVHWEPLDFIV